MQATPDAALVAAVLRGETPRFAELVRRHERRVRRIVARAVRDADTREELVQQTFCDAFVGLAKLSSGERFCAWLARIARSSIANHLQRARRESELEPAEWTQWPGRERREAWIWEEVDRLSPAQAEVLHLRYAHGRTYAEIAERLGVPCSTVRGRIHEARRALRERLTKDGRSSR